MPLHLFLDWSGTLWDDLEPTLEATNAVLRARGGREASPDEYRREFALPVRPFYEARLPAGTCPPTEVLDREFAEAFRRPEGSRLLPGAEAFVRRAVETGGSARIVSSLPQAILDRDVEASGLAPLLAGIHGGVVDKTVFLPGLVAASGISPDDALMLGDTPHDLAAARAARLRACAVGHGYLSRERLLAERPDEFWPDLSEARAWLERHLSLERRQWPIATVGGLVFDGSNRAFFVRTAKWSGKWGVPGGKIDHGETYAAAFRREIMEETGLAVLDERLVLVQDAIDEPEFVKPRHFLLLNLVARTCGGEVRLNHESLEGGWFDLPAALRLDLNRPTRRLVEHLIESGLPSPT